MISHLTKYLNDYKLDSNPAIAYTARKYIENLESISHKRNNLLNPSYPNISENKRNEWHMCNIIANELLGDNDIWDLNIFNRSINLLKKLNSFSSTFNSFSLVNSFLIRKEDLNVKSLKLILNELESKIIGIIPHFNYSKIFNFYSKPEFNKKSIDDNFMVLLIIKEKYSYL
jgi:hypothetical protein